MEMLNPDLNLREGVYKASSFDGQEESTAISHIPNFVQSDDLVA